MKLAESTENYLENILILRQRLGEVRSIDIANYMNFSKPSVSRAVHLLEDNGYIAINANGFILLTAKGESTARRVYERHVFLREYLIAIGVSTETAAEDACRMEHVISEETFAKLQLQYRRKGTEIAAVSDDEFILNFNRGSIVAKDKK